MNSKNTLQQVHLPPQAAIVAQINDGDTEFAVLRIGEYYESMMFCDGEEIWRQPHHDVQSAIFAIAQGLIAEYSGSVCAKLTRERIAKMFAPSYFVAG